MSNGSFYNNVCLGCAAPVCWSDNPFLVRLTSCWCTAVVANTSIDILILPQRLCKFYVFSLSLWSHSFCLHLPVVFCPGLIFPYLNSTKGSCLWLSILSLMEGKSMLFKFPEILLYLMLSLPNTIVKFLWEKVASDKPGVNIQIDAQLILLDYY